MKKSFYLKYLEIQKLNNKQMLDESKVKLRSSIFFQLAFKNVNKVLKILGYILLTLFVSIGATSLVNHDIREIFLNLFKGGF